MNAAIARRWNIAGLVAVLVTACGESASPTSSSEVTERVRVFSAPPRSMYFSGSLPVSNANTGAGSTTMTLLPGNQAYQIRVSGYITRTRIPDGNEFQFGPFGQGFCKSSGVKVLDYRGLRTSSYNAGDCSATNYQRYEWVATANLAQDVTIQRDGGTTSCSPRWPLNPCFVYSGSQAISIIPVNDTNVPVVSLSATPSQITVGDTVTFTATLGPPGQPTTVSSWQWIDDASVVPWDSVQSPGVSCTGTTCRYAPTRSGTMRVTATLRGASATATASVDVGCLFPPGASSAPFIQPFLGLLNSRPVRDSMNVLYHESGATGSLIPDNRREHGMFVHTDPQGHMAIQMVRPNPNSPYDGPCSLGMSPAPPAGYTTRLAMHIHPLNLGEAAPCWIQRGSTVLGRYRRGGTRQIQSNDDWANLSTIAGTPLGVVIDRTYAAAMQLVGGVAVGFGPSGTDPVTGEVVDTYVVTGYSSSNQQQFRRTGAACAWPGRGTE